MARRLKLDRKEVTNVDYQWTGAFRLRIECSDPSNSGADPNVFVYRRDPANPYDGTANDTFFAVASPVDLSEYPVGEPNPDAQYPFFRLDYVELDFRATSQANEVWVIVVREVNNLLQALDRLENLQLTEEVWVGAPLPTDPGGGSESGSSSA